MKETMKKVKISEQQLREGLKRHMSTEDFCIKYQITEEQLISHIKKTFKKPNYQNWLIQKLNENNKVAAKRSKGNTSSVSNQVEDCKDLPLVTEPISVIHEEINSTTDNDNNSSESVLSKLQEQENYLISQICNYEVVEQELISEDRQLRKMLIESKDYLTQLKSQLEQQQRQVEDYIFQLDNTALSLSETNIEISHLKEELRNTRDEIASLSKVCIYVYIDGSIDIENYSGQLPSSDTVYAELIQKVYTDEKFDALTLKEIKQISSLLALEKDLTKNSIMFEISFENKKTQSLWEELSK